MKIAIIPLICLTYVMLCYPGFASPPSLPERSFDFSFQVINEPRELGDILAVSWSFVLHHEADSLLEAIYSIDDSAIIAKAYIFTSPGLEYVSGDTLWWGHIKHDETHAFTASYRVVEPFIVGLRPIVETHARLHVKTLRTRKVGEGCRFDFRKKRKRDSTILLTANGDTVIFSNDVIPPTDFARIDTSLFRKPQHSVRVVELQTEVLDRPAKVGDFLTMSWSFTLRQPADTMLRRLFAEIDSTIIVKAFLRLHPEQEYVSGNQLWCSEVKYDMSYSLTATYKITTEGRINVVPIVQTCSQTETDGEYDIVTENTGKGVVLSIKQTDRQLPTSKIPIINGNDTAYVIPNYPPPVEYQVEGAVEWRSNKTGEMILPMKNR
jgi:hypothetical protein